jgi:serine/threonine-protein kinase
MYPGALATTIPATLGRYELLLPVARGGMGQVWAARLRGARGFNKLVAIKTVLPMAGAEGRLESMLLEEARIAALIHHPNVVQTLELGEHENTLYLVMEWVDGEPLSFLFDRVQETGAFPLHVAVNLVGQTLLGLHAAHELTDESGAPLGVVHRDVSPHNVLVSHSGVAKLVDFGIAKATKKGTSTTQTGEVKGKFSYMAPEQIRSETVDRRADVFAAGILLYTLTTGQHPFQSDNAAGLIQSIASSDPPPRPSFSIPMYSRTLEAVVMKALEKDVNVRFQTAADMLAALRRAVPAAFVAGFETQVRDFLMSTAGDRVAQRREALRRAQLAADARSPGDSTKIGSFGPGQSASSLRAMSIDTPSVEQPSVSTNVSERISVETPAHAARPRSRKALSVALQVSAVLACIFVLFRVVARLDNTARRAAASNGAPHAASPELRPAALPTASSAPAPQASTVPAPAPSATASSSRQGDPSQAAAPTASLRKAGSAAPKDRRPQKKPRELMSPY